MCPSSLPAAWGKGDNAEGEGEPYRSALDISLHGDTAECTLPSSLAAAQVLKGGRGGVEVGLCNGLGGAKSGSVKVWEKV